MNNRIIKGIEYYYMSIKNNCHSRYLSWEHCYLAFYNAIKKGDKSKKIVEFQYTSNLIIAKAKIKVL